MVLEWHQQDFFVLHFAGNENRNIFCRGMDGKEKIGHILSQRVSELVDASVQDYWNQVQTP